MFARTLAVAVLLLTGSADAVPVTFAQSVGFNAGSQSMWGPGGSTSSFGASGSASVDPPFLPEVGAGYSARATTGTANASVSGNLAATTTTTSRRGSRPSA